MGDREKPARYGKGILKREGGEWFRCRACSCASGVSSRCNEWCYRCEDGSIGGWGGSASAPWRASASCGKTCGSVIEKNVSALLPGWDFVPRCGPFSSIVIAMMCVAHPPLFLKVHEPARAAGGFASLHHPFSGNSTARRGITSSLSSSSSSKRGAQRGRGHHVPAF